MSFKSYIAEEKQENPSPRVFSAKAEKKIQSTTGAEKAFRRFISGDFRKNKTFGKDPSLAAKQSQAAMKQNPVAANVKKRITAPIKPIIKPVKKITANSPDVKNPKNVPIPAQRPVASTDTASLSKPKVTASATVNAGGQTPDASAKVTMKRKSSGVLNMVPKERRYKGTGLIDTVRKKIHGDGSSPVDPKHANAISADKARREPIDARRTGFGTPQAEYDRADSFRGPSRTPDDQKAYDAKEKIKNTVKATGDVQSGAKLDADAKATKPRPSLGLVPKKRQYSGGFLSGLTSKKPDYKSKSNTPVKDRGNSDLNPDYYKGTPQAELDRRDATVGGPRQTPDDAKANANKPLEVSNAKRDKIKDAIKQRNMVAEERSKVTGHKSMLGGNGLALRQKIRDRAANQKHTSTRYNVKEEEKKLGETDTGESGESIDTEPKKKELTGQER